MDEDREATTIYIRCNILLSYYALKLGVVEIYL